MSTIAAPILITVMMAFLVLGTASIQQTQTVLTLSTQQAAVAAAARVHTIIQMLSAAVTGGSALSLSVRNAGDVAISDFGHADVIVDYTGIAGVDPFDRPIAEHVVTRLAYTAGTPAAGQWRVAAINPDTLHPTIWNPGEVLTLAATLPKPAMPGVPGAAVFATPNGVTTSAYFTL